MSYNPEFAVLLLSPFKKRPTLDFIEKISYDLQCAKRDHFLQQQNLQNDIRNLVGFTTSRVFFYL